MPSCHGCGAEFPERMEVYRSSTCPSCGKDVKVCLNCEFYAPGAHWDCRETVSEPVREKDRANFCDSFRLATMRRAPRAAAPGARPAARNDFDKLFGNG